MTTKRTDVHRPSAIIPEDYQFVALGYMGPGNFEAAIAERKVFQEHMQRTGGKFSNHEHGGTCHVCGSVNALYTVRFYHAKTNSYITTGTDCAEKLNMGDAILFRSFREKIKAGIAAQAGKAKAQSILTEAGLIRAWNIYAETDAETIDQTMVNPRTGEMFWEEKTIRDIVGKLVHYGNISERQTQFLGNLLTKIDQRAEMLAKRAAEQANAKPLPASGVRLTITGKIISQREQATDFGPVVKILVSHADGWRVWGSMPRGLDAANGDVIQFDARVEKSEKDEKFGFFSRPTKAVILTKRQEAA